MIKRLPRSSDARLLRVIPAEVFCPVIPANAGIQVLNSSRALRATLKNNYGSRTAGGSLFFARAKKRDEKKARPDGATASLRFSPASARVPTRRARNTRLGLDTRRARTPMPSAMLGRAIRGGKEYPCQGSRWVAKSPVGASRAPSEAGSRREPFDRARAALCAAGELGERPAEARRTGNRANCARRSDRGGFLLVTFLCPSKEKSPAVGQPPTSTRRRSRHKTSSAWGRKAHELDSRFRGNDEL